MKKEFILNGTRINTIKRFYEEIENELLLDSNAIDNWSLDAFDDILQGGYGLYDLQEEIIIKWVNFRSSEKKMNPEILESIVKIFQSHENITFIAD
jgi:RNAse (barnase) inhibitor barstar